MRKTLLAATAFIVVAAAPANAGFTLNGFTLNGFTLNGFTLNGFTLNGARLGPIGINVGGHDGVGLNGQVLAIEL